MGSPWLLRQPTDAPTFTTILPNPCDKPPVIINTPNTKAVQIAGPPLDPVEISEVLWVVVGGVGLWVVLLTLVQGLR